MSEETNTVVALRPCGCIVFAAVMDERTKRDKKNYKQLLKEIGELAVDGFEVKRVAVEFVRTGRMSCPVCKPERYANDNS